MDLVLASSTWNLLSTRMCGPGKESNLYETNQRNEGYVQVRPFARDRVKTISDVLSLKFILIVVRNLVQINA